MSNAHHASATRTLFAVCSIATLLFALPAEAVTLTFSWDAPTEGEVVDGYYIYYDSDQSGPPYEGNEATEGASPVHIVRANLSDPNAPQVQLTGLASCRTYYFAITAYNSAGESGFSNEVPIVPVQSPRDIVVSPTNNSLNLSWQGLRDDDDGTLAGFRVYWDTDSGEPYSANGSPLETTDQMATISGLQSGQTYYLAVEAYCNNGEVGLADEVVATVGSAGEDAGMPDTGNGGDDAGQGDAGMGTDTGSDPMDTGGEADTSVGSDVGDTQDSGNGGEDASEPDVPSDPNPPSPPGTPSEPNVNDGDNTPDPGAEPGNQPAGDTTSDDGCACATVGTNPKFPWGGALLGLAIVGIVMWRRR